MLQYLYTGACLFPRDDLNLGVELLGVADQFMLDPMKLQCETLLSDKIDAEVGIICEGVCMCVQHVEVCGAVGGGTTVLRSCEICHASAAG